LERTKDAFSTLYTPFKNYPLWSESIEKESSLFQNKIRNAYSIFFYYDSDFNIYKIEHFPSIIENKLQTNYDDALKYSHINSFFHISQSINKNIENVYQMVEFWMIKTNHYIGTIFPNVPYRVQKSFDIDNNFIIPFQKESAYYSFNEQYHASLNLYKYTHFTSPIRRCIDCLIHYYITYDISINWDLDSLNKLDKLSKKFHQQLKLCEIINNFQEGQYYGYLYEIIDLNIWKMYFKELELFIKIKIVDDKLKHLIDENKMNNIKIGDAFLFSIHKKEGFLPIEKLYIKPLFSNDFCSIIQ
jgi:hypothetical protein